MGVGPVCQTSLPTGFSEWELGPCHAEWSPILGLLMKGSRHGAGTKSESTSTFNLLEHHSLHPGDNLRP